MSRAELESIARHALPAGHQRAEVVAYITERLMLHYHQGASLLDCERMAGMEVESAIAWSAEQAALRRERRKAGPPIPKKMPGRFDLEELARDALGHKPTRRQVDWVAERLLLAHHQGASIARLKELAPELAREVPGE